jgi:hypothetical protein
MSTKNISIVILLIGLLPSNLGCSQRNGRNITASPTKKEYPKFSHLELHYCEYCTTEHQVRKYEDSLGSKELPLKIIEVAQVFRYHSYTSQDSSGIYELYSAPGSSIDKRFNSYFAFERKIPELSPLRITVLYVLDEPSSDDVEYLKEVEWKFFFKDPILERYEASDSGFSDIDTGYVWGLFDTIGDRVSDLFTDSNKVLPLESLSDTTVDRIVNSYPKANEVVFQNSESGYFHPDEGQGKWFLPKEEIDFWGSKCPLDRKPYFFLDWRTHYREISWFSMKYISSFSNPGRMIGRINMAIGWSSSPDYYHRDKRAPDSNIHWFEIEPQDLAIYLVLTTAGD